MNLLKVNKLNSEDDDDKSEIKKSTLSRKSSASVLKETLSREDKLVKFEALGKVTKEDDGRIIKDENEEEVKVDFSTYIQLIECCGGWGKLAMQSVTVVLALICDTVLRFYIGKWATHEDK